MNGRYGRFLAALAILTATTIGAAEGLGYDPAANPFAQLEEAKAAASSEHKLILLVAGGDWCIWCHYLQAFLDGNAGVEQALEDTFVVVHVNYGSENKNEAFFDTLPEAPGYPHFWVLGADGSLLKSQGTSPLEDGKKSYSIRRFMAFVDEWKAKPVVAGSDETEL